MDLTGESRDSLATDQGGQALGLEQALDEMSLGDVMSLKDLLHFVALPTSAMVACYTA